jgi:hypothetical protein
VVPKIVHNAQLHIFNYWSPLACLVQEQEEHAQEHHTKGEMAMIAIAAGQPTNKVAVHWACKSGNRQACQYAFLDLGATSRAAPEEDKPDLKWQNVQENIHIPQWTHQKSNQEKAPQA